MKYEAFLKAVATGVLCRLNCNGQTNLVHQGFMNHDYLRMNFND